MTMSKKQTFWQYIAAYGGFGKTHYILAFFIHAMSGLAAGGLGAISGWQYAPLGLIPAAALWFGTYMNYTGRWK